MAEGRCKRCKMDKFYRYDYVTKMDTRWLDRSGWPKIGDAKSPRRQLRRRNARNYFADDWWMDDACTMCNRTVSCKELDDTNGLIISIVRKSCTGRRVYSNADTSSQPHRNLLHLLVTWLIWLSFVPLNVKIEHIDQLQKSRNRLLTFMNSYKKKHLLLQKLIPSYSYGWWIDQH